MPEANDPYAPPDDARMAAEPKSGVPDPDDVEATYTGTERATETWKLYVTPDALYFAHEEGEPSVRLTREGFAEEVNIGLLSGKRVGLLLKTPERRVVSIPREALDRIGRWLGPEGLARFRRKILRAGWGTTLLVGVLLALPFGYEDQAPSALLVMACGAVLVGAALLSRFSASLWGFATRALGWSLFAGSLVWEVALGRSPWILVLVGVLLYAVMRYVRWIQFFRSAQPNRG